MYHLIISFLPQYSRDFPRLSSHNLQYFQIGIIHQATRNVLVARVTNCHRVAKAEVPFNCRDARRMSIVDTKSDQ